MTVDKREFKRIERRFIMRVAVDDGNPWVRWSLVTTHNLSAGGALFTFDQNVKEGDWLLCKLHFIDREIDCKARVIRLVKGSQFPLVHLAVSFEWTRDKDHHFVAEYAKEHPEKNL